jgi:PAS domain S-box-containing protein
MDNSQFQDRLKEMRRSYENNLPEKLNQIKIEWSSYLQGGEKSQLHLTEMRLQVHKLSGSGATFGFQWVSDIAERIELLLNMLVDSKELPTHAQQDQIQAQLITLDAMKTYSPSMSLGKAQEENKTEDQDMALPVTAGKLLFMMDDDVEFSLLLATKLEPFGYKTLHFSSAQAFEAALEKQSPTAILMDVDLPEGVFGGAEIIRRINTGENKPVPVVFISRHKDFDSRLQAVRAGATHYLTKPFEINSLVQAIEDVSGALPSEPYRVLIIDDDIELAAMYRISLEEAGMIVAVENKPRQALASLKDFEPDLVLMDVLMPDCDGIELATIMRQSTEYDLTPIIFLTTEWRNDIKLAAMNLGSDDFLAKPIKPWHLVATLKARIKRARTLRGGTVKNRDVMHELENLSYAINQHAIVSKTDASGFIVHVNNKFCEVSGYSREELLGQNHRLLKSGFHPPALFEELWQTISTGKIWQGDIKNRNKNGQFYWVATTIVPILDDFDIPYQYISIRTEITHIKEIQ